MADQARPSRVGRPQTNSIKNILRKFSGYFNGMASTVEFVVIPDPVVTRAFWHVTAPDFFARTTRCRTGPEAARRV